MAYDVIILGGGVSGLLAARDCAQRGLEVLVLEKGDLAGGASGGGPGLLAGGPGAAAPQPHPEVAVLRRIAPHLVYPVPTLHPQAAHQQGGGALGRAAAAAGVLRAAPRLASPTARLDAAALYALVPGLRPGLPGALRSEAWGVDPHRLCVANALAAQGHGAEVRTWTEAREVLREDGRVVGVRWLDALGGETGVAHAPVVVNATGAWSPALAARSGVTVRLRARKALHLVLEGRLSDHAVVCHDLDGRALLAAPHRGETWLGATEADCWGDPDDQEATQDEVAGLLEGVAALLPAVRRGRVTRAAWALHASPHAGGPGGLPRPGALLDHAGEGAAGLLTLVSGPLADARSQAEAATDLVLQRLGRPPVACRTHQVPLPGGEAPADVAGLAARHGVGTPLVARVAERQGARAAEVLALGDEDPRLRLVVCRGAGLTAAELTWCARHESVRRLRDLRSRCRLGTCACGGLDCARLAAQLCGRELGWKPAEVRRELADLLEVGWRERRAVLDGDQLAEEELRRGAHWGVGR